jgi:hypothetical protein
MKIKALHHVLYEIERLTACGPQLTDTRLDVRRSIVESRLLHTRCLNDFFKNTRSTRDKKEQDDVIASDFGYHLEETPDKTIPPRSGIVGKINKFLSHVTYSRADEQPEWDFPETWNPLMTQSVKFLEHLLTWSEAPSGLLDRYRPEIKARLSAARISMEKPRLTRLYEIYASYLATQITTTAPLDWVRKLPTCIIPIPPESFENHP